MIIKILKTKQLSKKIINKICLLKNQEWNYGFNSNLKWFTNNIYDDDINFLLFNNSKLIAYNCLRKRNFYDASRKIKKKKIFIFDSLIVKKEFRKKGISKKLLLFNNLYLKKHKLISFLLCQNNMKNFYNKYGWKILKINKKNIINHRTNLNCLCFNIRLKKTNLFIYY